MRAVKVRDWGYATLKTSVGSVEPPMAQHELEQAADRSRASLRQVLMAYHYDPKDLYLRLYAAFETSHGQIVEGNWRHDLEAAVVLTANDELHIWFDLSRMPLYAVPMMQRIGNTYEDYQHISRGTRRPSDVQVMSKIAFNALSIIPPSAGTAVLATGADNKSKDKVPPAPDDVSSRIEAVDSEIDRFIESFQKMALVSVRGRFFRGLVGATVFLFVGAFAISRIGPALGADTALMVWLATSIAAGSLGGLTSALYRYLTDELTLDPSAGSSSAWRGALHAFLGAVFGVIAGALVQSGLLKGFIQPGDKTASYFYIALAFLAGFLERLVPDSLEGVGKRMTGSTPAKSKKQIEVGASSE